MSGYRAFYLIRFRPMPSERHSTSHAPHGHARQFCSTQAQAFGRILRSAQYALITSRFLWQRFFSRRRAGPVQKSYLLSPLRFPHFLGSRTTKIAGSEPYGLYLLVSVLFHRCATEAFNRRVPCLSLCQANPGKWGAKCEGRFRHRLFCLQIIIRVDTIALRFVNVYS
jgi:hypothetical protein